MIFAQVADGDVWEIAGAVLDEVAEDRLVVVANDEDLADLWDLGDGGEAVGYDGMTGDFEERLRTSTSSFKHCLVMLDLPLADLERAA